LIQVVQYETRLILHNFLGHLDFSVTGDTSDMTGHITAALFRSASAAKSTAYTVQPSKRAKLFIFLISVYFSL
jgi:hypothetical protein